MNPHVKNSCLYYLFEKIKSIHDLRALVIEDLDYSYDNCYYYLHNCVIKTKAYPFLNKYIDEYLKSYPNKINLQNYHGQTALIVAIKNLHYLSSIHTVKILLKHQADVNVQDKYGYTALLYAVDNTHINEEIVKLLLEHNANISLKNKYGVTTITIVANYNKHFRKCNFFKMITRKQFLMNVTENIKVINNDYKLNTSYKIKQFISLLNFF